VSKVVLATEQHVNDIVEMSLLFHGESPYADIAVDREKLNAVAVNFILTDADHVCLLLIADDDTVAGVLIGYASSLPFSEAKIASELVWYVLPAYRKGIGAGKLLKTFEYWARFVAKADYVQMVSVANDVSDKVSEHYCKQGYTLKEKTFLKRFVE